MTGIQLQPTAKQQEAVDFANASESSEFTFQCATGFGKTIVMTLLLQDESRPIVVFPTLVLLDEFRHRYIQYLPNRENIFTVCTYLKDMKMGGDVSWITQDKDTIKEYLSNPDDMLILTTYNSLPFVLNHLENDVEVIHFDEAHHRSGPNTVEAMDENSFKAYRVYNYSATPSEECMGGDLYEYDFSEAIRDRAIRDFTVHFIIGDKKQSKEELPKIIQQIANTTGNKKTMIFTALSLKEKEGKNTVNKLCHDWRPICKRLHIWIKGITCDDKPDQRRQILKDFSENQDLSFLVSCRTLGEGVDVHGTNSGIFMDAVNSRVKIVQNIGRLLRLYRDDDGNPLDEQSASTVILPVYVDAEAYEQCNTHEERDRFLRNLCETDNGSFVPILNVVSALREYDPEMSSLCFHYPSGLKREELPKVRETLQGQGWEVVDSIEDGNCFFHSVSPIVGESPNEIRRKVMNHLRGSDIQKVKGILDGEISELEQDGVWNNNAMDVVPHSFSQLYSVPLGIHWGNGQVEDVGGDEADNREHLLLIDDHYHRLVPRKEKDKGNAEPMASGQSNQKTKYRRWFRGHLCGDMKVLWRGEKVNDLLLKLEHQIDMDGKTREDLWDEKFDQLVNFVQGMDGTKLPSSMAKDADPDEKRLGSWVDDQKKYYKTKSYGMKVENIARRIKWGGFMALNPKLFITNEEVWDEGLEKLHAFVQGNGRKRLPSQKGKDEDEKILAKWLSHQNENYKKQRRVMKVENTTRRAKWEEFMALYPKLFITDEEVWNETLSKLLAFLQKNCGTKLPSRVGDDKVLGIWASTQKTHYTNIKFGMKDPTRRAKWEGFVTTYNDLFMTDEEEWDETLVKLRLFVQTNGGNKLPSTTSRYRDEKVLGNWVSAQNMNYKNEQHGMKVQNTSRRAKWEGFMALFPNLFMTDEEVWDDTFSKLLAFVQRHDGKRLPNIKAKDEDEAFLRSWVFRQTRTYKNKCQGMKDASRRAKWKGFMTMYSYLFITDEEVWDKTFLKLLAFVQRNDGKKHPSMKSKDGDEKFLGNWASNQNKNYKKRQEGMKEAIRRAKWEGFMTMYSYLFMTGEEEWDENLAKLCTFVQKHDGTKLPSESSRDGEEKVVGNWVSTQRLNYKNEQHGMKVENTNRRAKWEGFIALYPNLFMTDEEVWDGKLANLSTFVQKHNGTKLPSTKSRDGDEKCLGTWTSHQKASYKNGKEGMKTENIDRRVKWKAFMDEFPHLFIGIRSNAVDTIQLNERNPMQIDIANHQPSTDTHKRKNIDDDITSPHKSNKSKSKQSLSDQDMQQKIANMTQEEMARSLLVFTKANQKGRYNAPNTMFKICINTMLKDNMPTHGKMVVLDHTDFRTAMALNDPSRTIIPQQDAKAFKDMMEHPVFGKCVVFSDLLYFLQRGSETFGLVYADLTGSIKEAIPIMDALVGRVQAGGVIAMTISCRDGEKSQYVNEFSAKLLGETMRRFPTCTPLTAGGVPMVYGENVRMATLVMRL